MGPIRMFILYANINSEGIQAFTQIFMICTIAKGIFPDANYCMMYKHVILC